MIWADRTQPIRVGDTVRLSRDFLRWTGQLVGNVPQAKGQVTALKPIGNTGKVMAVIEWDTPDVAEKVLVSNLERVREQGRA